ncbi:MAG: hypothetical protein RLZZ53_3430 [Acidobacteriota bacterium]
MTRGTSTARAQAPGTSRGGCVSFALREQQGAAIGVTDDASGSWRLVDQTGIEPVTS